MSRLTLLLFLTLFVSLNCSSVLSQHFHRNMHTPLELTITDPPDIYNDYFAGAGACMLCHNSMTDGQGASVAIVNDWRSTMMANAARDPFWKAKVSHEVLVNPHLKNEIETVCTRCHAPMGNINAHYNDEDFYTIEQMNSDTLGLDGVSCTVCHQITPESMGNISGNFIIGTNKQIWGPYIDPFANPMIINTGYTPNYSEHIKDSKVCASCHTLITNSLDLDGVPTGEEFVEQAIYHEWKNSSFQENDISCQSCHVPEISDVVKISTMPPWLDGRTPFGKHHFQGANVFMLQLLKDNTDTLGLTTDEVQLDSTINRTVKNLQQFSVVATLTEINRNADTLFVDLALQNLAGHKLPSGYPSRRVFVELFAISDGGDTLFHSGEMNDQFELIDEDETFEPHHTVIDREDKVQIYEMVMGDVNNNVTTVLERAYIHLKDNRLPPVGFTKNHISYDTIQIVGNADSDENFNLSGVEEGTGSDHVNFKIYLDEYASQTINLTARVHYQTVTNKWLNNMFQYISDDIDLFKSLYTNTSKETVILDEVNLTSIPVSTIQNEEQGFIIYPNPAKQRFSISDFDNFAMISIYSIRGELINKHKPSGTSMSFKAPTKSGVYLVKVENTAGKQRISKLVVN